MVTKPKARYELGDKFWEIARKGAALTTVSGKIGKPGHTKIKALASPAEAKRVCEAAIAAKLKAGYVLAGTAPEAGGDDGIPRAIEAMKVWCRNNGVGVVAKNLAKGASDAAISKAERQLGVVLHRELRELWQLHDGQRDKKTRFLEGDFLSLAEAISMRPALAEPWLPISANDDDELVVVHAVTGSVAKLPAKGKKLKVIASSPSAWIAAFVKSLGGELAPTPKPPAKPITRAKPVNTDKLAAAIERAKTWMQDNGAAVLVKNLAKPASDTALARTEKELGFALPAELAAVWRIHDGQKREMNGFIGSLDLIASRNAAAIREDVLHSVRWMLEDEEMVEDAELHPEEANEEWIPFGTRDSDHLVVHAVSGRVFRVAKDAPPLSLAARSLTEFFERYAKAMEKGEYTVEEGFGDVYLAG